MKLVQLKSWVDLNNKTEPNLSDQWVRKIFLHSAENKKIFLAPSRKKKIFLT